MLKFCTLEDDKMTAINLNTELIIIQVSGADAKTYLQGQLTNDIHDLDDKSFQLSAHLNNKGRIIATFFITKAAENEYYLITHKTLTDKIVPRLKMFILRSKVECKLVNYDIFLSSEPQANTISFELVPGQFLIMDKLPDNNSDNITIWHKLLVDNALPMIYLDLSEKIIPQQVNYDLIGGVNFKKGCYTGQEIVARTHYLGKVKRRMVKFETSAKPDIGQTVVSPRLDNQEVGFIVDFYQENNFFYGLVSLQLDCINEAYLDNAPTSRLICEPFITESKE